MDMSYDGVLVMPSNYAIMNNEEMTYVDGGGTLKIKIKQNSFIISCLQAVGSSLTFAKATAALAAAGVAIATAIELGTAGTGTLYAGAFLLAWGGVIPVIAGAAVSYGIGSLRGKTFTVCSHKWLPNKTFNI